jgi:hypothetical protein
MIRRINMEMVIGFLFGCFTTAVLGILAIAAAIKNSVDGLE